MRTDQEYRNLEAERDALAEALEEWKASAYRSQTDCSVAASTIQQLSDECDALAAQLQEMRVASEDKLAKADAVILLAKIAMEPFIATRPSNRALAAIEQYQKGE